MPTVLITGANRGIGLEFARQYAADGWRVLATCRDPDRADDLKAVSGDVSIHPLDVADGAQIEALAKELSDEPIDILINNAGISGPRDRAFGNMDYDAWETVLRTNSLAPVHMAEAFFGNLEKGKVKKLVSITSQLGSIANNSGGYLVYGSSKAALNFMMKSLSADLASKGVVTVVFHPGWVSTDMGGPSAPITPKKSVTALRKLIDKLGPRDNGKYLNYDGKVIPW